jgi:hypothetical protein
MQLFFLFYFEIVYITPFVHKSDMQNIAAFFTFLLYSMKKKRYRLYYGAKGMDTSRMKSCSPGVYSNTPFHHIFIFVEDLEGN